LLEVVCLCGTYIDSRSYVCLVFVVENTIAQRVSQSDRWMQMQGVRCQRTVAAISHGTLDELFLIFEGRHSVEVRPPPLGDLGMCFIEVNLRGHRVWSDEYQIVPRICEM
jgi:hypothetical protein